MLRLLSFLFFFTYSVGIVAQQTPVPEMENVPVFYEGRFREIHAYASQWWNEWHHSSKIKTSEQQSLEARTPQELLWKLLILGHASWDKAPIFGLKERLVKQSLDLNEKVTAFSYNQLKPLEERLKQLAADTTNKAAQTEATELLRHLHDYEQIVPFVDTAYINTATANLPPKELVHQLQERFPLKQRLQNAGHLLKVLPGKTKGEWYSLNSLLLQHYDTGTAQLKPISNFTKLPDTLFSQIRASYQSLRHAFLSHDETAIFKQMKELQKLLQEGYEGVAGTPIYQVHGKTLLYPTISQLKAEHLYYKWPLTEITLFFYASAFILFLLSRRTKSRWIEKCGFTSFVTAFILHTGIIALRCYILSRPPVSNMTETIIYVPWIASLFSLLLKPFIKTTLLLIGSSLNALLLLVVLKLSQANESMENVQAVLDSQYWLIIHVMMIVGSYGVFALNSVLAHLYLAGDLIAKKDNDWLSPCHSCILQTLYIGVALLIPGTILGGVWAAQSWGRFWDWDPKESWAFISACIYLVWIHAYRFGFIGRFGLAIGSITGWIAITFTWYGVNYLLGTGLHSYGFGSGGNAYYYLFLAVEVFFILGALLVKKTLRNKQEIHYH